MSRSAARLALFVPGLLALLVGSALARHWETMLLLLFLVGTIFPAIGLCALIAWAALRASLQAPVDRILLLAAALSTLWLLAFVVIFFGAADPTPPLLAAGSVAGGLLINGLVILGQWGGRRAAAAAIALVLPTALVLAIDARHPIRPLEARMAAIQTRLQEVTGTLQWEKEGPALRAERDAVEARIEQVTTTRWHALERVPAAAGLLALAAAALVRRRFPTVGLASAGAGVLCLLLAFGHLAGTP